MESIASLYLRLIKDDFNITIDEMADYLSCSYDYVQKNIAPCIHHIYQFALVTHCEESEHIGLFTKRKLFFRKELSGFILTKYSKDRASFVDGF
ncbi:hypothetical protein [Bacillus sp. Ba 3]|uniref:hypothetical protein n=1 Tax=Bacillus sp. Ba 3 TaxID=3397768 RepID=UPI0039E12ED3